MPNVTLVAVTGTMLPQTLVAIDRSRTCASFGDVLLVTDRPDAVEPREGLRVVAVPALNSREAYSLVVQTGLAQHVHTDFAMLVQWDGYPVRAGNWTDAFFDYDYIGAPWPQFPQARAVGNGGFCWRSRRLLEACLDPRFEARHPEDLSICHHNRTLLEQEHGLRFAPVELAARFSYERVGRAEDAFGFHGLFNMPAEMGIDAFLDDLAGMEMARIGVRELCDLRDVLKSAGTARARTASRSVLSALARHHWKDSRFWRYLLGGPVPLGEAQWSIAATNDSGHGNQAANGRNGSDNPLQWR